MIPGRDSDVIDAGKDMDNVEGKSHEDMDNGIEERKQAEVVTETVWTGTPEELHSLIYCLQIADRHMALANSQVRVEGDMPKRIAEELETVALYIGRAQDELIMHMETHTERGPEKLLSETTDEEHRWRDFKSQIADQVVAVLAREVKEWEAYEPIIRIIRSIITGCTLPEYEKKRLDRIMSQAGFNGYADGCSYPKNEATLNEEQG